MRTLIAMVGMLLALSAWSQPIQRQFFTTNTNPRVIVAAGTNVTVQYTTTGPDIRTYTVNSTGGGGTQTNISYTAITNAPWQWGSQNLTNWSQLGTNVLGAGQVWTNNGTFIWPTVDSPPDPTGTTSGPAIFFRKDGSVYIGSNIVKILGPVRVNDMNQGSISMGSFVESNQPATLHFDFFASANENYDYDSAFRGNLTGNGTAGYAELSLSASHANNHSRLFNVYLLPDDIDNCIELFTNNVSIFSVNTSGVVTAGSYIDASGTSGSLVAYGVGNRLVATNANYLTNGYPWTNIYSPGISGGSTNQVYTQTGWSGYPQTTNLSLVTNGLGTAIVPTLWLTNPTPAALNAQQNSPALMLGGQGWRSGNSTSYPVQMGMYVKPFQGAAVNPTMRLYFMQSVAGSVPADTTSGETYFDSGGNLRCYGISVPASIQVGNGGGFYTVSRGGLWFSGDGQFKLLNNNSDGFSLLILGPANALSPALKVESTNAPTLSIRTGADANYASLVVSNVTATATMTATNGYVRQLYATNGYTVCTQSKQVYLVNAYTNPMFVLPDASTVVGKQFTFSTTNRGATFIVTNATGTQTIADGTSLSYTNNDNGLKAVNFISDGAAWWLGSKGRTTLPCASWSCSTNTTFANVTNTITLDTTEMNNLSGIYLDNSAWYTAGVGSRMWVTNPGVYMLTFSAVWSKVGGGSANGDIWLRQNGTDLPRTMTLFTIQNATSTNCMTVNFMLPVTGVTYFDLQGASPDGSAQLQSMPAITSPFNRPACPSIIVTLNKTSD